MQKTGFVSFLGLAMLIGACNQPPPERTTSDPKATASTDTATARTRPAPSDKALPMAAPAVTVAASAATAPVAASAEPPMAANLPKIPTPRGVEFVPEDKWRAQEPDWAMLNGMEHSENGPIMDIIVMHAVVLATAENELDKLKQIQRYQMDKAKGRGWGTIAAHYMIGPSGKVYEGRALRYRSEAMVGSGMGRFQYPWGKCVIMLLGNFSSPDQVFTSEAQTALTTLIEDRKSVFGRAYKEALKTREAETRILMGSKEGQIFGLDVVRIRNHTTLPPSIQSFLDGGSTSNEAAGDGGI